ncbi:hypothetical protein FSO04_24275 [Paraburkholderia madseniana]|uniref:HTH cro/C1-type domain-containing protein n=1 Tax=Paraburkholderia madseniana TaxID=2599607 RepID=A0A6N6WBJ3_9BURK|nr:helix-turn-helix transcriptional regulator [Paraburkholderia madseniana]KAE8757339.1 hypothetical protein FSO04_24275 [Paraburkholderia madseniana]
MKKTIQRHRLSDEEKAEAARLRAIWESFKVAHPGVSQEWLGNATGIGGQSAVSQYLRGEIMLNFANLIKFCNVLGANPSDISPRLVHEHLGDPALKNDLYARTAFATHGSANSPIRRQNTPLSNEARELIGCVARLDGSSPLIGKTFRLATGLLLLSAKANETQDMRTTEEIIGDAERLAADILSETQQPRAPHEQQHRKDRRHS